MQSCPVISLSPSFNSYSSGELAEIAARVVEEFRDESELEFDDMDGYKIKEKSNDEDGDDDDFEFPNLCGEPKPATSADEIFYNGQIRPMFPVFDRNLLFADVEGGNGKVTCKPPTAPPSSIRVPLGKLFSEDRDPPSCSSSEADDFDGVPEGTYCVWSPKAAAAAPESPGSCRKSSSTGSSKRWKFRELIGRSNSDGRDMFVFLSTAKKKDEKASDQTATTIEKSPGEVKASGKARPKVAGGCEVVPVTAAHEAPFGRTKVAAKDAERRRSFLPYRKDMIGGFFANVNGMSQNLHPF